MGSSTPPVWVEKILAADEEIPEAWPVAGTLGYDFLNDLTYALTDPAGIDELEALTAELSGRSAPFCAQTRARKPASAREGLRAGAGARAGPPGRAGLTARGGRRRG